jgi:hypothetical protein
MDLFISSASLVQNKEKQKQWHTTAHPCSFVYVFKDLFMFKEVTF